MNRYRDTVDVLAAALAPLPVVTERDPVRPPAVIVRPGSPWMTPGVLCGERAESYVLTVVGHPFDADDGDYHLADLIGTVLDAVDAADLTFREAAAPSLTDIGGTTYIAAEIEIDT
jgi:hypothetical protein